jgi:hypothetical protein
VTPRLSTLRIAAALLSMTVATAVAPSASAQITGTGGASGTTSSFSASDFVVFVQSQPGVTLRDFDLQRFFNIANCQCNIPVFLLFTFTQAGLAKRALIPTGTVEFWVGYQCDQVNLRETRCTLLGSAPLTTFAGNGGATVKTDAQTLSINHGQTQITTTTPDGGVVSTADAGTTLVNGCEVGSAFDQSIYMLITFSGHSTYDVVALTPVRIDLLPPPAPTGVTVQPGNEALVVNWTPIDVAALDDFLGYQVLCDRGGALQVFPTGTFAPGFLTCASNPIPDGTDSHVLASDEAFVCSDRLSATTTSFRIKILENDVFYGVSVVGIDTHYNPSQPIVQYMAPTKTLSFYEKYRNGEQNGSEPGRASGGFCAVAGDAGRTGGVGFAALLVTVGLGLTALRRRKRGGP